MSRTLGYIAKSSGVSATTLFQGTFVNVTDQTAITLHGNANGDGTGNDRDAIQAAIDYVAASPTGLYDFPYGGVVFVPAGTYPLGTGPALKLYGGVQLVGEGAGSILNRTGSGGSVIDIAKNSAHNTDCRYARVSNLAIHSDTSFVGGITNTDASGVRYCEFSDLEISTGGKGISFTGGFGSTFTRIHGYRLGAELIYLKGFGCSVVSSCHIEDNVRDDFDSDTDAGFVMMNSDGFAADAGNNAMHDNICEGTWPKPAYHFGGGFSGRFRNNFIELNYLDGDIAYLFENIDSGQIELDAVSSIWKAKFTNVRATMSYLSFVDDCCEFAQTTTTGQKNALGVSLLCVQSLPVTIPPEIAFTRIADVTTGGFIAGWTGTELRAASGLGALKITTPTAVDNTTSVGIEVTAGDGYGATVGYIQLGGGNGLAQAGADGGSLSLYGGAGSIAGSGNAAGAGGPIDLHGGTGGTGAGSLAAGAGGNVTLTGGDGGTGTATVVGGHGGDVVLQSGARGSTGGAGVGIAGSVILRCATFGSIQLQYGFTAYLTVDANGVSIANDKNFVFGTGSGSQIGTAANQKLAFHGQTPCVQRSGASQAAVATTAATQSSPWGFTTQAQADGIVTLLNEIRATLVEKGIFKGSA